MEHKCYKNSTWCQAVQWEFLVTLIQIVDCKRIWAVNQLPPKMLPIKASISSWTKLSQVSLINISWASNQPHELESMRVAHLNSGKEFIGCTGLGVHKAHLIYQVLYPWLWASLKPHGYSDLEIVTQQGSRGWWGKNQGPVPISYCSRWNLN